MKQIERKIEYRLCLKRINCLLTILIPPAATSTISPTKAQTMIKDQENHLFWEISVASAKTLLLSSSITQSTSVLSVNLPLKK